MSLTCLAQLCVVLSVVILVESSLLLASSCLLLLWLGANFSLIPLRLATVEAAQAVPWVGSEEAGPEAEVAG